jgi:protein-tyrosine phosphatase
MVVETGGTRLELNGAFNFRDLGGYKTKDDHTLRPGLLFRSDDLWRLSDTDVLRLKELGLKCVIDLRSENEATTRGIFPIEKFPINYIHVSLADVSANPELASNNDDYLFERYKEMLVNSQAKIAHVVSLLADHNNLPAVFHCAAGKARTGLIAALILGVLGVYDETIMYDYAKTRSAMTAFSSWLENAYPEVAAIISELPPVLFSSEPLTMKDTLTWISDKFGSIEKYLVSCGVTEHSIARLHETLLM